MQSLVNCRYILALGNKDSGNVEKYTLDATCPYPPPPIHEIGELLGQFAAPVWLPIEQILLLHGNIEMNIGNAAKLRATVREAGFKMLSKDTATTSSPIKLS